MPRALMWAVELVATRQGNESPLLGMGCEFEPRLAYGDAQGFGFGAAGDGAAVVIGGTQRRAGFWANVHDASVRRYWAKYDPHHRHRPNLRSELRSNLKRLIERSPLPRSPTYRVRGSMLGLLLMSRLATPGCC